MGQQLLSLAVEPHLIIIGVVWVVPLLTVAQKNKFPVLFIQFFYSSSHHSVALRNAVQQPTVHTVVEIIVTTSRAVAPPENLTAMIYQLVFEQIDIHMRFAYFRDDHLDFARGGIDATELQCVHRATAAQVILPVAFFVIVQRNEIIIIGSQGQQAALPRISI